MWGVCSDLVVYINSQVEIVGEFAQVLGNNKEIPFVSRICQKGLLF